MTFSSSKISDFVDFNPPRIVKKKSKAPYIKMSLIKEYRRDVESSLLKKYNGGGSRFKNGDTLMARITPCLENGKSALVSGLNQNGFGSTEFIVMTPKEPDYDKDFVYYITLFSKFREYAIRNMSGTSGRQRVSWQTLSKFKFNFPDKNYRKASGDILRKIDDKILLNDRINKKLEELVQAMFKSWFVDFDPVHAKRLAIKKGLNPERSAMAIISGICSPSEFSKEMDNKLTTKLSKMNKKDQESLTHISSLFPSEFVDSKLGKIPKGWVISSISNIAILDTKTLKPNNAPSDYFLHYSIPSFDR